MNLHLINCKILINLASIFSIHKHKHTIIYIYIYTHIGLGSNYNWCNFK